MCCSLTNVVRLKGTVPTSDVPKSPVAASPIYHRLLYDMLPGDGIPTYTKQDLVFVLTINVEHQTGSQPIAKFSQLSFGTATPFHNAGRSSRSSSIAVYTGLA